LPYNLDYVSPFDIGCLGTISKNVWGFQTAGLYTKAENIYGLQVSLGRNVLTNKLIGIQIAGIGTDEGTIFDDKKQTSEILGIQVAGLYSKEHDFCGIQADGIFSKTDNFCGIQTVGLTSRTKNFNGLQISGLYSESEIFYGIGISSLLTTNRFHGIGIGLVKNESSQFYSGTQISSLFSICGDNKFDYDLGFIKEKNTTDNNIKVDSGTVYGLQAAGLVSKSTNLYGIKIGGFVSDCDRKLYGISIGGLSSYNGSGVGLCISSIYSANYRGQFYGLLASGVLTYSEYMKGLQISPINIASNVSGMQIGGINYISNNLRGLQIGAFNESENVYGVQIGVFNYCRTLKGLQIGVINNLENASILKLNIIPLINFCW
jgi:hypothetical protein